MKKGLIVIAVLIIMLTILVGCTVDYANNSDPQFVELQNDSYELLKEFVTAYPDRTSGAKTGAVSKADEAAVWLKDVMAAVDGELAVELKAFDYNNPNKDNRTETAFNVIARKSAKIDTDKTVVIGAYYDNAYGIQVNGSIPSAEGVYSNAGSVAALLQTVAALKNDLFDFNIDFIAFGAAEASFAGSKNYVNNNHDDIILMINYNNVVGGEHLYYYSDEVKTGHAELTAEIIGNNRLNINAAPKYVHNMVNNYIEGTHLGYYKAPMLGDHIEFLKNDINTVSFSSANYNDHSTNQVKEFSGKDNIIYTSADTLATVVERYGGGEKGIKRINDNVSNVVSAASYLLRTDNFTALMEKSRENKFDYSVFGDIKIMQYIGYGLLGFVLVACVVIYFALKAKAKAHPVIRMTPYGMVDMATGEIKNQGSAPQKKIDPFDGDFGNDGESGKDVKADTDKNAKDVDKHDIFDDF